MLLHRCVLFAILSALTSFSASAGRLYREWFIIFLLNIMSWIYRHKTFCTLEWLNPVLTLGVSPFNCTKAPRIYPGPDQSLDIGW